MRPGVAGDRRLALLSCEAPWTRAVRRQGERGLITPERVSSGKHCKGPRPTINPSFAVTLAPRSW